MPPCPTCGKENEEDARFCSACGTTLSPPGQPPREIRKTMTVVFTDVTGSFQNGGGMAVVSIQGLSLILDAADEDSPVTIGFASDDCDADHRLASERGAETLEAPEDRAWGVRAAYLRGPGQITFEIEQSLPSPN